MLGDNIRKYRKANNLSQEELAEKLSVSRQSISLWETGKSQPSVDMLTSLAAALGVSVDGLLSVSIEKEECIIKEEYAEEGKPKQLTFKNRVAFGIVVAIMCVLLIGVACWVVQDQLKTEKETIVSFSDDPEAIEQASQSVVKVFCYDHSGQEIAIGSGVMLFHNDMVVTNYHVIEDSYAVKISTEQDITYSVDGLWHKNEKQDIAILKLEKNTDLAPLKMGDSSAIKKGETVTAVGSPLGIKNTVSKGNLSARIMQGDYDVLQFTAPISNGSSGGALFNEKGEVIGITYASFVEGQNLNLAIPVELVNNLYLSQSLSMKPEDIKDIYWSSHIEEYIAITYGNPTSVSFVELKKDPEKYLNKMISIEAFVSSVDAIGNLRTGMYISSQKNVSSNTQDYRVYSDEDFSLHNLVYISPLRMVNDVYTRNYVGAINIGNPGERVLITGVLAINDSGEYRIAAIQISAL